MAETMTDRNSGPRVVVAPAEWAPPRGRARWQHGDGELMVAALQRCGPAEKRRRRSRGGMGFHEVRVQRWVARVIRKSRSTLGSRDLRAHADLSFVAMLRFLHDDLWPRLEALSKKAKRTHVAVAYLASGASKLLRLHEDDVLVVDMGDASVKTGRTDPNEISKYLRAGVRVYSVENLHAKAFVFDDTVIVGSSNVSNHSKLGLAEAALETTNAALCSQVIAWIKSIALAPVTPKLAAAKAKIYKPPKWSSPVRGNTKKTLRPEIGRLWIINSQPVEFTEEEEGILDDQATTAKSFLKNKNKYEVETIRYSATARFAREARLGHLAIVIHSVGKTTDVYPPARVVYTRAYKAEGAARVGVHLERHTDDDLYYWGQFRKAALSLGMKVSKHSNREIRDPELHAPLLRFFGREA